MSLVIVMTRTISSENNPTIIVIFVGLFVVMISVAVWGLIKRRQLKQAEPMAGQVVAFRKISRAPGSNPFNPVPNSIGMDVKVAIEYRDPLTGDMLISQQQISMKQLRQHLPSDVANQRPIYLTVPTPVSLARNIEYIAGAINHAKRLRDQGVPSDEINSRLMNNREADLTGYTILSAPVPVKVWVDSKRAARYVVFEWND